MKIDRVNMGLGLALAGLSGAAWRWLTPNRAMGLAEVEARMDHLTRTLPVDEPDKSMFIERLRVFAAGDDGKPVYMVNLMRYFDEVRKIRGIPEDYRGTAEEANAHYEKKVMPIAIKLGAQPLFAGPAAGPNVMAATAEVDGWNRIILMRYPSRRSFIALLSDAEYQRYLPYKLASLELALIPANAEMLVPDFRVAAIGGAAMTLGAAALMRKHGQNGEEG